MRDLQGNNAVNGPHQHARPIMPDDIRNVFDILGLGGESDRHRFDQFMLPATKQEKRFGTTLSHSTEASE